MAFTPPEWFLRWRLGAIIASFIVSISNKVDYLTGQINLWLYGKKHMMKIGVVGDLSMRDPADLARALKAAVDAKNDVVVQLGDMHDGYSEVKSAAARMPKDRFLVVKGNHDIRFEQEMKSFSSTWVYTFPQCCLVGLDNSMDGPNATLPPESWSILDSVPNDGKPIIVFIHKPLTEVLLQTGADSNHIMGDGNNNADGNRLKAWLSSRKRRPLLVCGHYHDWTFQQNAESDVLMDGRGGAGGTGKGELGWSQIIVTDDGRMAFPKYDLT